MESHTLLFIPVVLFMFTNCACTRKENLPEPVFPLQLPENISYIGFIRVSKNDEVYRRREAFVSNGEKWRSESNSPKRKTIVIICNGIESASANMKDPLDAATFDTRTHLRQAYSAFSEHRHSSYKGFQKIHNYNCWLFKYTEDGGEIEMWVDIDEHIPRKWVMTMPEYEQAALLYDFPCEIALNTNKMYDLEALKPEMLNKVALNWSDIKI